MDQAISTLQKWIDESDNIVFFGGQASARSPVFPTSAAWTACITRPTPIPPETILSHSFFAQNPAEFYRFYREKILIQGAKPNPAHLKLAELERAGKLKAVVTQNIDGLHQAAGSKAVYELHGSTLRNYCARCKKKYPVSFLLETTGVPRCTEPNCGAIVRPDVVLYEEGLDADVISGAVSAIRKADMLIIGDLPGGLSRSGPGKLLHRQEAGPHQQISDQHGLHGQFGHQRPHRGGLFPDHRKVISSRKEVLYGH